MSCRLPRPFRPRLDRLEPREVPAVVTSLADTDAPGTLRRALLDTNQSPTDNAITFGPGLSGTITLTEALPRVVDTLTLTGPGRDALTVSGAGKFRVFDIAATAGAVGLSGLAITDGRLTAQATSRDPRGGFGAGIVNAAGLTLSGVRLQNNSTEGVVVLGAPTSSGDGAAVYTTGPLTVDDSQFVDNRGVVSDGGAIFARGAALRVTNSAFTNNRVTVGSGGAIFVADADLTVENSTFTGNTAEQDGGAVAAAVFGPTRRTMTITGSTLAGNQAEDRGGGVDVGGGYTLRATGVTLSDNRANGGGVDDKGLGGAVYVEDFGEVVPLPGEAVLEAVTLVGNTAANDGGAVFADGRLTFSRGLVRGNAATNDGGGLWLGERGDAPDQHRLTNLTVTGNTAGGAGGGVFADDDGAGILVNLTVAGNTAGTGGGLGAEEADGGSLVFNSIVVGNTATAAGGAADADTGGSAGGNVFGRIGPVLRSRLQASDLADVADAGLLPLADNGSTTLTFGLTAASPARNRGLASGSAGGVTLTAPAVDQRGVARPQGEGLDAGAFEAGAAAGTRLTAFGAGAGGGPRVTVYGPDGQVRFDFFAYEPTFTGGVRVAVADVNADGTDDLVVGTGAGGGPRVRVFDGSSADRTDPRPLLDLMMFEDTFRGGVHVAAASATAADGTVTALLVVGAGSTAESPGGPRVRTFRAASTGAALVADQDFFAYDPGFRGGVRVAAGDQGGDGTVEFATIPGPSGGPDLRVFARDGTPLGRAFAFDPAYRGGAFVAMTGGQFAVTPDAVPGFADTVLADAAAGFPDQDGRLPGLASAANTASPPVVYLVTASPVTGRLNLTTSLLSLATVQRVDVLDAGVDSGVRVAAGTVGTQQGVIVSPGRETAGRRAAGRPRAQFLPLTGGGLGSPTDLPTFPVDVGLVSVFVGAASSPPAVSR